VGKLGIHRIHEIKRFSSLATICAEHRISFIMLSVEALLNFWGFLNTFINILKVHSLAVRVHSPERRILIENPLASKAGQNYVEV